MKKASLILGFLAAIIMLALLWQAIENDKKGPATSFEECVAKGHPVMESYPRQCNDGEKTFTEFVGNELEKIDLVRLESPRPNETISSPLIIRGEARGTWFFEASFPVTLVNWDGLIIAESFATAQSEWMTTDFVPFEAKIEFEFDPNTYSNRGFLILRKDNPSGLPEHDDALEIPIYFEGLPQR